MKCRIIGPLFNVIVFIFREEDVSSCQSQMDSFQSLVQSLKHWFMTVNDKIPPEALTLCLKDLTERLQETKVRSCMLET